MPVRPESYVTKLEVSAPFDSAVDTVVAAFKEEGFGVLTTIDVTATMRQKLGIEMPRYTILGMCNPRLAHRALTLEPDIGVMLPCNVAVYERGDRVVVAAQDPGTMVEMTANLELEDVALEASGRIERAMERVKSDLP